MINSSECLLRPQGYYSYFGESEELPLQIWVQEGKPFRLLWCLAPQDPRDDWEVPRPWRVFRHSGDHIYWIGHLARNLAFILKKIQGVSLLQQQAAISLLCFLYKLGVWLSIRAGNLRIYSLWEERGHPEGIEVPFPVSPVGRWR